MPVKTPNPSLLDHLSAVENQSNQSPGRQLRRQNRQQILILLARHQSLSRSELCLRTGLTGAAVSRITRELLDAEMLRETKERATKGNLGRRKSSLSINPDCAWVFSITIAANKLVVALVDACQQIIKEQSVELNPLQVRNAKTTESDPQKLVQKLIDVALCMAQEGQMDRRRLVGIGVSVAVPSLNSITSDGRVTSQILGWNQVPVAQPFQSAFDLPVAIESRAMSLLRAEVYSGLQHGRRQSPESVFLINVGLGIGTAFLSDDHIHSAGTLGSGGLTHLPHQDSDIECYCGRVGCLEMSASGAAVVCELRNETWPLKMPFAELRPNLDAALKRATAGDRVAKAAFFDAGVKMSKGVDTISCLINPDVIVLAGETGRQPDFLAGIRRGLKSTRSPLSFDQIYPSTVSSVRGAACTALDAFIFSPDVDLSCLVRDLQSSNVDIVETA